MRTLWSVSVFGLVPFPSPAATPIITPRDLRVTSERCDLLFRRVIKRMATKEELARIRQDLEEIGSSDPPRRCWRLTAIDQNCAKSEMGLCLD